MAGPFNKAPRPDGVLPGLLPIEDFLVCLRPVGSTNSPRRPQRAVNAAEVALLVMDFADYLPQRRLRVPDDPLHPENKGELKKYLDWFWEVLAR